MKTSRLIYKSIATAEVVSNPTLRDLESNAASANAAKGITGLLVMSGNVFLQVLEGSAVEITGLFGRIMQDKRHRQVELITFETGMERYFEDWNMRLVDLYDLPGDKRALISAKYPGKAGEVCIPSGIHSVYAFLFDARELCLSAPWHRPTSEIPQQDESTGPA